MGGNRADGVSQGNGQGNVGAATGLGVDFQVPAIGTQALPDAEEAESAPLPTQSLRPGHLETHPVIPHMHFQAPAFPLDGDLDVFGLSMFYDVDQQFIDRLKEENLDIFA